MNLKDLETKISIPGTRAHFLIEPLLINLLKIHISSQNKELFSEPKNGSSFLFDAFAPNGFDEFDGATYIAFEYTPNKKDLCLYIEKSNPILKKEDVKNLLFISTRAFPESFSHEINSLNKKFGISIFLWGPDDIQSLIDKHRDEATELGDKLFTLRLESAFHKPQKNWKEHRKAILESVITSYNSGQFSFFLGAGVSSSAGMPDWNTLLNSLFVSLLTSELNGNKKADDNEISSIVRRLREIDAPSALMAARYIRRGLSNSSDTEQSKFIETVTSNLYKLRDKRKSIDSTLIKSITSLCMPGRMGAKVRSVITYNFDDLIERSLENKSVIHKSIFEESVVPIPDELPIYHVHGFLPENRSDHSNLDKETLVFSEEGYHKIYHDPYHWSNLVQLNHLRETTCLMIGLSMTDPNLRRLLEISSRSIDRPKHYAFMQRIKTEEFIRIEKRKVVNAPISTITKFLDRHHSLNEEVLKELGVNIIWYEEHDEIHKIINKMKKN